MKHVTVQPSLLLANALYSRASYFGGATLNLTFDSPSEGYQVSIQDGPIFNSMSEVNEHTISQWIKDNAKKVKEQGLYFGSWRDNDTRKVYFDISANIQTEHEALKLANKNNQLSIYDIKNKTVIYTKKGTEAINK